MHWMILALAGCGSAPTASPSDPVSGEVGEAAVVEPLAEGGTDDRPVEPPPPGTLLFVSERSGDPRVWVVSTHGGDERELVGPSGALFPAAADPKGTHALVIRTLEDESGHAEQLWLVPLERSAGDPVAVTPVANKVRNPSWGPGGDWLVFESDAMSYRDLFRVQRSGEGLTRLTEAEHGSFEPMVSANGERVAFGTSRDGNAEVYTMAADGTDPVRVTRHDKDDTAPRWSPDGASLAWSSRRDGSTGIWVVRAGGQPTRLLPKQEGVIELDAVWSPDGRFLAVPVQTGPKEVRIDVVSAADGKVVRVLDGPGPDEHPTWSPDGEWLAWSSSREGEPAIYVTKRVEDAAIKVSSGKTDWLPRWVATP